VADRVAEDVTKVTLSNRRSRAIPKIQNRTYALSYGMTICSGKGRTVRKMTAQLMAVLGRSARRAIMPWTEKKKEEKRIHSEEGRSHLIERGKRLRLEEERLHPQTDAGA